MNRPPVAGSSPVGRHSVRFLRLAMVVAVPAVLVSAPVALAAAGPVPSGLTWSTTILPRGSELAGIWARSAGDVWAVGLQPGGTCQFATLTVHWNGSAWTVQPSPGNLKVNSALAAVSGSSGKDVWAVGDTGCPTVQNGRTLALHWNGTAWSIVKTPNPGFFPALHAVAARTPADAWAVGDTVFGGNDDPLIEHWNGTAWLVSKLPRSLHGSLSGVAVAGATGVWAVGSRSSGSAYRPMALRWNGHQWSQTRVPIPAGTNGYLSDVVTLPHRQAVAVGAWRPTPGTSQILVEEWNGKAWHMASTPPVSGFSVLFSAAAAPGQGPWAAGFAVTNVSGGAVVLHRVARKWRLVSPPPLSQVMSVAAASGGEVWAVYVRFIAHGIPSGCDLRRPGPRSRCSARSE